MRIVYELSDNTETFKIIFYKKGENEASKALKDIDIQMNEWVKVMGTVRVFKEQTAIVGNQVTAITDHNEITNHFLQVFVAHNVRKKGVLSQDQLRDGRQQKGAGPAQVQASGIDLLSMMSNLMKRNDMRFIDKDSILQECRNKLTPAEVDEKLKVLLDDGSIYTAMNQNVFSLTDQD